LSSLLNILFLCLHSFTYSLINLHCLKILIYKGNRYVPNSEYLNFSSYPCFHCYTVGGAITHLLVQNLRIKTQEKKQLKQAIEDCSRKCKITWSSYNKQHINHNSYVTEWNDEPMKRKQLWSFGDVDGLNLLHLFWSSLWIWSRCSLWQKIKFSQLFV